MPGSSPRTWPDGSRRSRSGCVDERFTTTEAHDALRRGGKDARARRQVVDAAAAAVLLQAALDTERATGRPAGQLVRAGDGAGT